MSIDKTLTALFLIVIVFPCVMTGLCVYFKEQLQNEIDVCHNTYNDCEKYICITKLPRLSLEGELRYYNKYIACKLNETEQVYKYKHIEVSE